jgi:hypothetical protein
LNNFKTYRGFDIPTPMSIPWSHILFPIDAVHMKQLLISAFSNMNSMNSTMQLPAKVIGVIAEYSIYEHAYVSLLDILQKAYEPPKIKIPKICADNGKKLNETINHKPTTSIITGNERALSVPSVKLHPMIVDELENLVSDSDNRLNSSNSSNSSNSPLRTSQFFTDCTINDINNNNRRHQLTTKEFSLFDPHYLDIFHGYRQYDITYLGFHSLKSDSKNEEKNRNVFHNFETIRCMLRAFPCEKHCSRKNATDTQATITAATVTAATVTAATVTAATVTAATVTAATVTAATATSTKKIWTVHAIDSSAKTYCLECSNVIYLSVPAISNLTKFIVPNDIQLLTKEE